MVDEHLGKFMVKLRVGSLCTGSGMDFAATRSLAQEIRCYFLENSIDIQVIVENSFACEKSAWKRKWIKRVHKPRHLFKDVNELAEKDEVWDCMSMTFAKVPKVDILISGFNCQSVSLMNVLRRKNKDTIKKGKGKSGSTLCQS